MDPYDFYSNNGLHRIYNNHGMKSLTRRIDIPDIDLGIGFAEFTGNVAEGNYLPTQHFNVVSEAQDVQDTFILGKGGLNIESFPMDNYYGEVLGAM